MTANNTPESAVRSEKSAPPSPEAPMHGDLIERLERATGANRDLYYAVCRAVEGIWGSDEDCRAADECEMPAPPCVTSSLDAALALVERVLPGSKNWKNASPSTGWKINLYRGMTPTNDPNGFWEVQIREHATDPAWCAAKTPALAVLIALLRALNTTHPGASGEEG